MSFASCAFAGHRCSAICARSPRDGQLYVDWLADQAAFFHGLGGGAAAEPDRAHELAELRKELQATQEDLGVACDRAAAAGAAAARAELTAELTAAQVAHSGQLEALVDAAGEAQATAQAKLAAAEATHRSQLEALAKERLAAEEALRAAQAIHSSRVDALVKERFTAEEARRFAHECLATAEQGLASAERVVADERAGRAGALAAAQELGRRAVAQEQAAERRAHAELIAIERASLSDALAQLAALTTTLAQLRAQQAEDLEQHEKRQAKMRALYEQAATDDAAAVARQASKAAADAEQRLQDQASRMQRELDEARKALTSSNLRGRLSELELYEFCYAHSEGEVRDISRDGRRGDLLVVFPNRLAIKIESKRVVNYEASFEDEAFACLDELGRDYEARVAAVVVVNTHPSAKLAFGRSGAFDGHNRAYDARSGVFGHYLSGGAELWQPALRTILQLVNKLPADAEAPGEAELELAAILRQREELSESLNDFLKFLNGEQDRLGKEEKNVRSRLAVVKAKITDVKTAMADKHMERLEAQNVLERAAGVVQEQGGWGRFSTLKAWGSIPELQAQICRFWPRHFSRFLEEAKQVAGPASKRARPAA